MVRIFPVSHFRGSWPVPPGDVPADFLWGSRQHRFFSSGTAAIRRVCLELGLTRRDEVCILTPSDSTYVTTCVSATIFNYCTISRVVSDRTRLLYVIHEFGVPHPGIKRLVADACASGIPLLEDCAHTADSLVDGQRVGTFGDYALYSLPKLWPVNRGGVLVGGWPSRDKRFGGNDWPADDRAVEEELAACLPYLPALSARRKQNFRAIRESASSVPVLFEYHQEWTPFFVVFNTPFAAELYSLLANCDVEWGLTHVPDWFAVPTQPLLSDAELASLIRLIQNAFNECGVIGAAAR